VILYLLFPLFDGLNSKPYEHLRHSFYGKYAMAKAVKVLEKRHWTDAELTEAFRHTSEKISKFLLFIIIPVMALVSWLLGFKKRKYFYDNFVFSIEVNSFFLLWGFLIFPIIFRLVANIVTVSDGVGGIGITIVDLSVFLLFVVLAAKRFFGFKLWYSILYSALYTFILAIFIQYIYKFLLFYITIHLV
jgi:hypothetical protein